LLSLRTVFIEQFKKLSSSVLIESVGELGNGRGDFQALMEYDFLALKANIFGPFNKAGQVCPRANILTYQVELGLRNT